MEIDRRKSNLKIKQRTKKKVLQNEASKNRRNAEKELLKDANVIFGLDNGTTGTISCMFDKYLDFLETPSIESLDYTQEIQKMNRIDILTLKTWFENNLNLAKKFYKKKIKAIVILERPMVNPQRFKQSRICIKGF